jgi:low temperature requirement protein LtrA
MPSASGAGTAPAVHAAVSPLELFFDLVFVFAVSQLSHHLLAHPTWRGAAETLVLLIAVFGVWAFTSFEATLLRAGRLRTGGMLLAVMLGGFFMNAGVGNAFGAGGAAFVAPLLVVQVGRSLWAIRAAPTGMLREHYTRLLGWIVASAPLWLAGAAADPAARLRWWAPAAALDLVGMWLAHPVPGRSLHSEHVAFDADHMLERCRLFLIIALGEAVLTAGAALAAAPPGPLTLLTGTCALVTLVALWALYFGGSDHLINRHAETTPDPIFAVRMAVNGLVVVVAGLIALAVGHERVIAEPHGAGSVALALLLFGGPLLYLASQTWYLWAVTGSRSYARLAGLAALAAAGGLSLHLPPFAALGLLATVLTLLIVAVLRQKVRRVVAALRPTGTPRGTT